MAVGLSEHVVNVDQSLVDADDVQLFNVVCYVRVHICVCARVRLGCPYVGMCVCAYCCLYGVCMYIISVGALFPSPFGYEMSVVTTHP